MKNVLLSILIPTKDRYRTLIPVLSGLTHDFKGLNVEFIVQDNTLDNNEITQYLSILNCEKIKYFHTIKSLSQSENCNCSVKNSNGQYLILIGDDDYVLPSIIDAIVWMENNHVECLNYNIASYLWNDISFKYNTSISKGGTLLLKYPLLKDFILLDPKIELAKVVKSGGTDYANLPRLYHGIVKRSVLDQIYQKCNTYFPGLSPDMANSSALAVFTKVFYKYNFPLSISGKSASSAAGKGVNHTHVGDLDKMTFLDEKLLKKWNFKIPYFWSGDTIYAQSLYHSLNECDFKAKINYNRLYAHLLVYEWKSISKKMSPVLKSIKHNPFNLFVILFWYLTYFTSRVINYLLRKIKPKHYYDVHYSDEIQKCVKIIDSIENIESKI